MSIKGGLAIVSALSILTGVRESHCLGEVSLQVAVSPASIVERCPIIVSVSLVNTGSDAIPTSFSAEAPDVLGRSLRVAVRSVDGEERWLEYPGGIEPLTPAVGDVHRLEPGASIRIDHVMAPVYRQEPPARWAGHLRDLYTFLAPGQYRAQFELTMQVGQTVRSAPVEITVLSATGVNSAARNLVSLPHVDFLVGRDRPFDETDYGGRRTHNKVDVSRFSELQAILTEHPESSYAGWIRYWKLYHHGPSGEALRYLREHADFPLADNLMLRVAEKLFHAHAFAESRAVITELLAKFPGGDTRAAALDLQARLDKKP